MTHHAWLDSLSEDWVSQPRSETSQLQLPTTSSPPVSADFNNIRDRVSRIPRLNTGHTGIKRPQHQSHNSSPSVLSERNPNDINIKNPQHRPSKLSQEPTSPHRGRVSRSASSSSVDSVVHNSVVRNKSQSASPSKNRENVPEWKRRLIYGEFDYGESKDLFSSAGSGLENIFRPPPTPEMHSGVAPENEGYTINETTLPSSPPPYSGSRPDTLEDENDDTPDQDVSDYSVQHNATLPRPMSPQPTEDDDIDNSHGDATTASKDKCDESESQLYAAGEGSTLSLRRQQLLDESRKTSGQSVIKNEEFSPIFIARRSSESGRVSFAPMDLPPAQLRKKLEILRRNQIILDSEPDSGTGSATAADEGAGEMDNTDEYAKGGGFLNLQRGGRSVEGSFRQRPLSPPINMDSSEMLPESSLQASTPKQFPTFRIERFGSGNQTMASPPSPPLPRAPHPSPEKRLQIGIFKNKSPLKLFGPYDTFTNQTLLRRISQFEEQHSHTSSHLADGNVSSPKPVVRSQSEPLNVRPGSRLHPTRKSPQISHGQDDVFGDVNRFGGGELDGYEFDGDISLSSSIFPPQSEEKENMTPTPSRVPSRNSSKFDIHEDVTSDEESLVVKRHRQKASPSVSPTRSIRVSKSLETLQPRTTPQMGEVNSFPPPVWGRNGSEVKRPRTSPSKDPTPKRRRTLHRSDIAYGLDSRRTAFETVQSSHFTMQSAMTHERTLSVHHMLRPRSPTPSQRALALRDRQPLAELGFSPVPGSANAPEQIVDSTVSSSRKASMKTQDFYEAAEEVMAMIRNKARPMAGLASVEESEAESSDRPTHDGTVLTDETYQESTQEPFSRPPSRDGRPLPRLPVRQEDPVLVDQLKKYEEHSDIGDILTQSIRSTSILQTNEQPSYVYGSPNRYDGSISQMGHISQDGIISDIPNVRLSRNPERIDPDGNGSRFPSHQSQSFGTSTAQSIPTASSRGDSRRLIAPDVVAQLIGNQVGNMVFDEENKMWQKVKKSRPAMNILPSEDSEEDPFASIPDLTVDETKEMKHLDLATGQSRPSLAEDKKTCESQNLSPSKSDRTAEESIISEQMSTENDHREHVETPLEDDEEIEHEISLHEDRMQQATPSQRRNLTITFSSPIASIIQDFAHREPDSSYETESSTEQSFGNISADSMKRGRNGKVEISVTGITTKSTSRSRSRGMSKSMTGERHAFIPRPVSRIDEQDETMPDEQQTGQQDSQSSRISMEASTGASNIEPTRNADLSVVMATPAPVRTAAIYATPMIGQYVGNLSLSPMSEFTIHQVDHSCALEVSYVVGDQYLVTGDGSKKIMSKAVRTLVEKITEIEPFEPDWESIPDLDLSNKQLDTLHMLDEFCTAVVTLDASHNTVTQLDGVPQSVRNLRMTHNLLSELTAWGQLINLQYIDVSNNQLRSLSAFQDLVHLRSLRADNNQITSLDGIKFHDSLQVLRARGNLITQVDFDGTKMRRLTELDLENNQIIAFENSDQLTCLNTLNLQNNCLTSFSLSKDESLPSLRYLKLSNNELETLDISVFPSLRLLHADRNNIRTITGFARCRHLDSLSLREQKGENILDTSFLESACEVRKLFLSGNRISGFNPQVDFLNLQYLELANCGLQSLAPDVGQLMPNLRFLNINFNAIDDLWPLRYIPRLKKLLAAGNRLSDAAKVAKALAEFPHLSRLDLRHNGATLGFYAPVQTLVSAVDDEKETESDPFVLPDVEVERQEKFASRLDINTRMRKRVYDMVVLGGCRQLKMLDGLPVAVDAVSRKDDVWEALVKSGIIQDKEKGIEQEQENTKGKEDLSSR